MLSEWIISASALATSIIFFVITFSFPTTSADPGGLALFPRMAALLTGISSALFLVKLATGPRPLDAILQSLRRLLLFFKGMGDEAKNLRRSVFVFAVSIFYPVAILKIGFLLASFAFSFILVRTYRGGMIPAFILSLCLALAMNVFFVSLLGATVPSGDWAGPLLDRFNFF
jgi:putative tricarboxylic transport membrane protein